jgi:VIT1/CCC1 family predicted Fe2+/Mn2+ transporter
MQYEITHNQSSAVNGHESAPARLRRLLLKRIWLPHGLYEALPVIYIASGLIALAAALFLPDRAWFIPWSIIFSFAAIHLGLGVAALRHRFRRSKSGE